MTSRIEWLWSTKEREWGPAAAAARRIRPGASTSEELHIAPLSGKRLLALWSGACRDMDRNVDARARGTKREAAFGRTTPFSGSLSDSALELRTIGPQKISYRFGTTPLKPKGLLSCSRSIHYSRRRRSGGTAAIVDETGWGARFSRLAADGIVADKFPAGTPPRQQWPASGMAIGCTMKLEALAVTEPYTTCPPLLTAKDRCPTTSPLLGPDGD